MKIEDLVKNPNIASDLKEDKLQEIASKVIEGYDEDKGSRSEWEHTNKKIQELYKLSCEEKDFPFPKAANVKFPITTTAILQLAARIYPEIVRNRRVVGTTVIGKDPDGSKGQRAKRISEHMSYQLLIESPNWEEHMDRLLYVLFCLGVAYKKTYYDPIKQRNESILCLPDDIVVNDNVDSLEDAPRISHRIKQSTNTIISYMRAGIYTEIPVEELDQMCGEEILTNIYNSNTDELHEIIEQHCYLDLDDDDYEEPYIVTVHRSSRKVLRIVARFDPDEVLYNQNEEIINIKPVHYFTDYHCIHRADGKFHSYGIATLLLHPNQVINSLLNQLIDAGTLASIQGGYASEDLGLPKGQQIFSPGEIKTVKMFHGKLEDKLKLIQYNEPSDVLFRTLQLMLEGSKDLVSVTDINSGKQSATNVPATTITILAEEGKKIYTSLLRRLYRSLKSEFEKLFRLNRIYLKPQDYYVVLDDEKAIFQADYEDDSIDVRPVSDPNVTSETQRLTRLQFLQQMLGAPGVNSPEILKELFEGAEVPNPERFIMPPGPPPPDPKLITAKVNAERLEFEKQTFALEHQLKMKELEIREKELELAMRQAATDAQQKEAQTIKTLVGAQKAGTDMEKNYRNLDLAKEKIEVEKYKAQTDRIKKSEPSRST